jgi:enoyl-[acyl-carrier protein] reductase I
MSQTFRYPTFPLLRAADISAPKVQWKANEKLAVGKGATVQEFYASVGNDKFEIDVAPWGEGHLRINGHEIASVNDAKDRRQAFRQLDRMAVRYLSGQPLNGRGTHSRSGGATFI